MNRYKRKKYGSVRKILLFLTIGVVIGWNTEAFSLLSPKLQKICSVCHNLEVIREFDLPKEEWVLVLKAMVNFGAMIQEEEIPDIASELANNLPFRMGVMSAAELFRRPEPFASAVFPFRLYVPNEADDTVSVIDALTNRVYAVIPFFVSPHSSIVAPDGSFALVVNSSSESNFLAVIDTKTNKIVNEIKVGKRPKHVELNRNGTLALVANQAEDTISIVNIPQRKEIAKIAVGEGPHIPKVDREGKFIWVTNEFGESVSIIDIGQKKVVDTIAVGLAPMGLAFSLNNKYAFVGNMASGSVSVIDVEKRKVIKTIPVGKRPNQIEVSSFTGKAYVALAGPGEVAVIDEVSLEVIDRISLGGERGAHGIRFNPTGQYAYITNQGSHSVSLIKLEGGEYSSSGHVVSIIPVGRFPSCI